MTRTNLNSFVFAVIFTFFLAACSNNTSTNNKAELEYDIEAKLGEGAFWNHVTQEFYWVDIEGLKLHIYDPASKENRTLSTPTRIGTVVPTTGVNAVVALVDGIYLMNTTTGDLELLSDVEADMPANRFNDGKCDPNGNLWVGSMFYEQNAPNANLYKITPSGEATIMKDSVTISNGIVWTSDQKTMYYIDTPTAKIMAYDYDASTATISNERIAVEVSESDGFPDGMAIDSENMLWVGLWNGSAVGRYNPKNGELISKIEVPALNVTACAFGGEDLDVLYITTARLGTSDEQLEKWPNAGSIFKANPGVKGVKSAFFGEQPM